ncbi:MAG: hypothetical protein FD175_2223 [Beijerinckiaceae bacterium]|nr:MAG: hypothetical protein FD175_2223 [Beijerinckiaceae bacterium]
MSNANTPEAGGMPSPRPAWAVPLGGVAVVFGITSLVSGGMTLFGSAEARAAAGAVVPFILWFNFFSAPVYIAAGMGLMMWRRWGAQTSLLMLVMLLAASVALLIHIAGGGTYELRTVFAMMLRVALWAGIVFLACKSLGCAFLCHPSTASR